MNQKNKIKNKLDLQLRISLLRLYNFNNNKLI